MGLNLSTTISVTVSARTIKRIYGRFTIVKVSCFIFLNTLRTADGYFQTHQYYTKRVIIYIPTELYSTILFGTTLFRHSWVFLSLIISVRLVSAVFGSSRLCSALLGSFRFFLALFRSSRLCQTYLDYVRLCQGLFKSV